MMGLFDFMSGAGENEVTDTVEVSQDRLNVLREENIAKSLAQLDIEGEQVAVSVNNDTAAPSTFYTVQSGDTLGKIAAEHYGNAGKYMAIFEANKPMLSDPDKIYPGQSLRIPPL